MCCLTSITLLIADSPYSLISLSISSLDKAVPYPEKVQGNLYKNSDH